MTKNLKFQKELLEKIKPGIKASDIKKKQPGSSTQFMHGIPTPPDSPVLKPSKDNNSSLTDEENIHNSKKIKELQKEVKFWSTTANTHLKNLQLTTATLTNLEEQLKSQKPNKPESEQIIEK